jgi:hypothetical protein
MSFMLVKLFLKSVGSMLINLYFFKSKWPFKKNSFNKIEIRKSERVRTDTRKERTWNYDI